jgi:hypothetical protein
MPPHMFDCLPLIDTLLAIDLDFPPRDSLHSHPSTTTIDTMSSSRPYTSSNDSIRTTETRSTDSAPSIRAPSLYSGGPRRGPVKRVSFSTLVDAREAEALDLADDDVDDEDLGADLSAATRAERAIYKHTLRCKGMAAAIRWWEWKQKEKRKMKKRSCMSLV